MYSVTARKGPVPVAVQRLNMSGRPIRTPHAGPLKVISGPAADQVRFGKIENITGPIPPASLVVLVPGMCSPAESMRSLWRYLNERGHSAHILESPFNLRAGCTVASTNWLTHGIDRIRLAEASKRYMAMLTKMEEIPHEDRVEFLRKEFGLQSNELGVATAKAALGLMFTRKSDYRQESDFTRIVLRLRKLRQDMGGTLPSETAHKQLYQLTTITRNQLHRELLPVFMASGRTKEDFEAQHMALEKTIDHVVDRIAPRVVLVGHSMGGFVSMLTLFEQMHDTAMVVGLSAPGENGTDPIPTGLNLLKKLPVALQQKGREILESVAPGLRHMLGGSPEADKLKANHQPFNSTIFAVGMPGDYDGLVGEQNFRMNDELPGRINVVVTPKLANIIEMASHPLHQLHQLVRTVNPVYSFISDFIVNSSDFLTGIAYHCGLTQYHKQYWAQDGDILRGVLEAPKKSERQEKDIKYDYSEHGKPDYDEANRQIRRLLDTANYEAERVHILSVLQDNLADARKEKPADEYAALLKSYRPLSPMLKEMSRERQPLSGGVAEKAEQLLALLTPLES